MRQIYMLIIINVVGVLYVSGQTIGVKTNILYDATTTLNLGTEITLSPQWTLDLSATYNPWEFSEDKKMKIWFVQPEARYWFCEKFNGHFVGLHVHYGSYNLSDFPLFGMSGYRYQGDLVGGGFTYGYQWVLNNRWNLEASIGLGYAHLNQEKFECGDCGAKIGDFTKHYLGPTKIGISLIYIIK